ncbi:hypothetical protein Q787_06860 [Ornithobacterium rhinotracheale H06-030791]|nr:hypothetical protein Q785_07045 [Ornithobacterium rhinotracheale ORT-UMN 88]KGB66704.1 hypothetical protein Q787_06860 [Ornithobacterium rhinotracheale H06-030791]
MLKIKPKKLKIEVGILKNTVGKLKKQGGMLKIKPKKLKIKVGILKNTVGKLKNSSKCQRIQSEN